MSGMESKSTTRAPSIPRLPFNHARSIMLLVDADGRIIALFAGRPLGADFDRVVEEVTRLLENARRRCRFKTCQLDHKRGRHAALAKGMTHGGGSKVWGVGWYGSLTDSFPRNLA